MGYIGNEHIYAKCTTEYLQFVLYGIVNSTFILKIYVRKIKILLSTFKVNFDNELFENDFTYFRSVHCISDQRGSHFGFNCKQSLQELPLISPSFGMEETKIIYYIDDEDTPYLIKLPIPADRVTLGDFKNALNRPNYKFFFKSVDDDFG